MSYEEPIANEPEKNVRLDEHIDGDHNDACHVAGVTSNTRVIILLLPGNSQDSPISSTAACTQCQALQLEFLSNETQRQDPAVT